MDSHHHRERALHRASRARALLRQLLLRLLQARRRAMLLGDLGSQPPRSLDVRRARGVACQLVALLGPVFNSDKVLTKVY